MRNHLSLAICFLFSQWAHASTTEACLEKATETAVRYERQWIQKNEQTTPTEEVRSVDDSHWSKKVQRGIKFGIFVESSKTQDNTHWEITLDPVTCKEMAKPKRKSAPEP